MINNIKDKLFALLEERMAILNLKREDVLEDESIIEQGIMDSISFLEFIVNIEQAFNVEIDLSNFDPTEFTSINKLAQIIENGN